MERKKIGAGIVAIEKQTGKLLLALRAEGGSANTFAPFGGTFEDKDETPRNTAIREFEEETKIDSSYKLSKKPFYVNNDNHLTYYNYLGFFDHALPAHIDKENNGYGWFDINNLPDNLHPGVVEMLNKKKEELEKIINMFKNANY